MPGPETLGRHRCANQGVPGRREGKLLVEGRFPGTLSPWRRDEVKTAPRWKKSRSERVLMRPLLSPRRADSHQPTDAFHGSCRQFVLESYNDEVTLQARFQEISPAEIRSAVLNQESETVFCNWSGIYYGRYRQGRIWVQATDQRYALGSITLPGGVTRP